MNFTSLIATLNRSEEFGADTEYGQAQVRVIIGVVSLVIWFGYAYIRHEPVMWHVIDVNLLFLMFAYFILDSILKSPKVKPTRLLLTITVDVATATYALWAGGADASFLVFVYVWVSAGNGLRFGPNYAVYGTVVSFTGFWFACWFNPSLRSFVALQASWVPAILFLPAYIVILAHRITVERKKTEDKAAKLAYAALHDSLTGLPNRKNLNDRLVMVLKESSDRRRRSDLTGVMFIDLDGFKAVNDTHGHNVGDALLQSVSEVLSSSVRGHDFVARLGGDEFAIIANSLKSVADMRKIADKIIHRLRNIKSASGRAVDISASIGIAVLQEGDTPQSVLQRADETMYQAKHSGKNQCMVQQSLAVG